MTRSEPCAVIGCDEPGTHVNAENEALCESCLADWNAGQATSGKSKPAPIGAPARSIEDRLGEALRREHHGLILPLWENLDDRYRESWRQRTCSFRTILQSVGLQTSLTARPGAHRDERQV